MCEQSNIQLQTAVMSDGSLREIAYGYRLTSSQDWNI